MNNFSRIKPLKLSSEEHGIYFVSDLHFGHSDIIKFCNRPYRSVQEMDEALTVNWNSVVKKDDTVFDLGDFAFAPDWRWKELLGKLNGHHILIIGNHDCSEYPGDSVMELFERVETEMLLEIDEHQVYLNHFPFLCYAGSYRNAGTATIQLFGHVHSGPRVGGKDKDRLAWLFPNQYDVGVDNNNYMPVSWQQVLKKIKAQTTSMPIITAPIISEHTIPDEVYVS